MCCVPEQGCVFWGVFLHISCWGEMDFGAQGYIVTDAAPMKPVKEEQGLIVSTSRACLTAVRIRKEALLGLRMDTMEEEKKVKSRAAVTKCRVKKKREEEEKLAKMERLRKENEDISQRTAVHQQVPSMITTSI